MSSTILLIVIYIAFISLGLPDSILGTAWPKIRLGLHLPLEAAGVFIMITTLSTAISSFLSGHIIGRLGTGRVTFISCVLTGSMLVGYSLAPSYGWLLLLTVPLGFGAGAVDTGLNNYVAKNYTARHMSWLHCFWGIGASLGPVVMTFAIARFSNWRTGYRFIGITQLSLAIILLLSLPLWKQRELRADRPEETRDVGGNILQQRGVWLSVLTFLLYVGMETGTGVWLGSLLVESRGVAQVTAGLWVSLFYASITAGRFLSGFVTQQFTNRQMIRGGLCIAMAGLVMLALPVKALTLPGIILIGLGCAPVFPCMVHETPRRFGGARSEVITGYQVGMAYMSGVALIPLVGLLGGRVSLELIPACILLFAILTLIGTERLNQIT